MRRTKRHRYQSDFSIFASGLDTPRARACRPSESFRGARRGVMAQTLGMAMFKRRECAAERQLSSVSAAITMALHRIDVAGPLLRRTSLPPAHPHPVSAQAGPLDQAAGQRLEPKGVFGAATDSFGGVANPPRSMPGSSMAIKQIQTAVLSPQVVRTSGAGKAVPVGRAFGRHLAVQGRGRRPARCIDHRCNRVRCRDDEVFSLPEMPKYLPRHHRGPQDMGQARHRRFCAASAAAAAEALKGFPSA